MGGYPPRMSAPWSEGSFRDGMRTVVPIAFGTEMPP
jgi:hypothetical protein